MNTTSTFRTEDSKRTRDANTQSPEVSASTTNTLQLHSPSETVAKPCHQAKQARLRHKHQSHKPMHSHPSTREYYRYNLGRSLLKVNKLVDHRPYHIHTHNSLHMIQVPASTYAYDNSATFYSIAASSLYRIHFDQRLFKKQNSCLVLSLGVG